MSRFRVIYRSEAKAPSPYRLVDPQGEEVVEANRLLDRLVLEGFSEETARTYAYRLRVVWEWMAAAGLRLDALSEARLLDLLQFMARRRHAPPAPRTKKLTLDVVRRLYRFHCGGPLPSGRDPRAPAPLAQSPRRLRGRAAPSPATIRIKVPKDCVISLTTHEVRSFFATLRSWRDVAITSLMLFAGLRAREVRRLTLEDVQFQAERLLVRGKGDKQRLLPMAPEVARALANYLNRERPETRSRAVFVLLKGRGRGRPLNGEALRALFRYHRLLSAVGRANPHRFRHTFGADMTRGGVPLPALQQLMGHSEIATTMRYVHLADDDIRAAFLKAIRQRESDGCDG
jgi:site-specific recombinase XerD